MSNDARYTIDRSLMPPSCLPTGLHRELVDITKLGDNWRVYIDRQTGEIHDGAVYFARAMEWVRASATPPPRTLPTHSQAPPATHSQDEGEQR